MEEEKNIFLKNKKILILSKKNMEFEKLFAFNSDCDVNKIEDIYKKQVYYGIDTDSLKTMLINENNYEANLCHVWKFEDYFFLSEDKFSEALDEFVLFQVMENDYDLIPDFLINYAKKYETLTTKQEELEKEEGEFNSKEYNKLQEQVDKLLINAQKRTYKETYIGETIVIKIK